ncbi:hypothetical protein GCM10010381_50280 [Streptomyces xantholiticus]|nr:hypothetical protein GCM10010381_50280 [Streptomyces xantholiticus]
MFVARWLKTVAVNRLRNSRDRQGPSPDPEVGSGPGAEVDPGVDMGGGVGADMTSTLPRLRRTLQ